MSIFGLRTSFAIWQELFLSVHGFTLLRSFIVLDLLFGLSGLALSYHNHLVDLTGVVDASNLNVHAGLFEIDRVVLCEILFESIKVLL